MHQVRCIELGVDGNMGVHIVWTWDGMAFLIWSFNWYFGLAHGVGI